MRTSHVVLCRGRLGAHRRIAPSCGSNSELHNSRVEDPQNNTGIFHIQETFFKGMYTFIMLCLVVLSSQLLHLRVIHLQRENNLITGFHADTNLLPGSVMSTHGKHGLKVHCSEGNKSRKNWMSGCPVF